MMKYEKKLKVFILMMFIMVMVLANIGTVNAAPAVGKYVQFGKYYGQPILWRVINNDANGTMIFMDKIITVKPFDAQEPTNVDADRKIKGSNNWSNSNLREWLNSDVSTVSYTTQSPNAANVDYNAYDTETGFLSNFATNEQNAINPVTHKYTITSAEFASKDGGSAYHIPVGTNPYDAVQNYDNAYYKNTTDKVFPLSIKELNDYVYSNAALGDGATYILAKPTAQAVSNTTYTYSGFSSLDNWYYFVRDSYSGDSYQNRNLDPAGAICQYYAKYGGDGVRAALYLKNGISFSGTGTAADPYVVSDTAPYIPTEWSSTTIVQNKLDSVIYANGQYVAVGDCGEIQTSPDGVTWTNRTSGTVYELNSVTYGNGLYVAVGVLGKILTSPDGITWTERTSETEEYLRGIAYGVVAGNGMFVAVGANGIILTSPNGMDWSPVTSPPTAKGLDSVTFANNKFVAAGGDYAYSTNGVDWTRVDATTVVPYAQKSITYGDAVGLFVTVGDQGTATTSPDGITWTKVTTTGTISWFKSVTYANGMFVAVGLYGEIRTSVNGTDWTKQTSGTPNLLLGVTYGNGQYVAVGDSGKILTSPDAIAWTSRTPGIIPWLQAATYGNGLYVAVGDRGRIITSSDRTTWTERVSGVDTAKYLNGVTYGNGLYVAVGGWFSNPSVIATSPDGINWTNQSPGTDWLLGVAYGNGKYVAVGWNGRILTSPDGVTWTSQTSPIANHYQGVTYGNGLFVAVSEGGKIVTSPDGETWTSQTSPIVNHLYAATYGNGLYVVVGDSGKILTSPNGSTWSIQASPTGYKLQAITYGNGIFVAVGQSASVRKVIIASRNGVDWYDKTTGISNPPWGVTYANGYFLVVGRFFAEQVLAGIGVTSEKPNGTYITGEVIDIDVYFDKNVVVTGTPQLKLETGVTDRIANYISGSGTNILTFRYIVQAGDNSLDLDYVDTASLMLNGGTIKGETGIDAILTLALPSERGSLGYNKNIVIGESTIPTCKITASQDSPTSVIYTFAFSEGVTGFDANDVTVINGTKGAFTGVDGSSEYTLAVSDIINSEQTTSIAAGVCTDAAGNSNIATSYVIPTTIYPSVTLKLIKNYNAPVDFANVSKIIVSNDNFITSTPYDFVADPLDPNCATIYDWSLNTATQGLKSIYVKYIDWAGNETNPPIEAQVIYTGIVKYFDIDHNQIINVRGQEIEITSPETLASGYTLPSDATLDGNNTFENFAPVRYGINLTIPNEDVAANISNVRVDLQINSGNISNVSIDIKRMALEEKLADGSYKTISGKIFVPVGDSSSPYHFSKSGANNYYVELGDDLKGHVGTYRLKYFGILTAGKNPDIPEEKTTQIINEAILTVVKPDGSTFVQTASAGHKTYIETNVWRSPVQVR